jgi:DAACS family dicarboxylate/amino acid:cation (Na+ or H+) symporter
MDAAGKRGMPLHVKVLIALVLGFGLGLGLQQFLPTSAIPDLVNFNKNVADPVGNIFLNMIFMIVVPLLFSALVLGVAEIGEAKKFGKIGLASLGMTILLSGIAVIVGLTLVNTIKPGAQITPEARNDYLAKYGDPKKTEEVKAKAEQSKTVGETVLDIVTKNPFKAVVEDNVLGFMFFALIFGLALSQIPADQSLPVKSFLEGVFAASLKVIEFAMKLAPIGVFALTFKAGSSLGLDAVRALGMYMIVVLLALAIHQFGVYSIVLKLIAKRDPLTFFRQIREVMLTAFSTSSSNATLPVALRVAEEKVGLPRQISNFVLTVGATANQNGTALFEGITILFVAQLFGVDLDLQAQITVMLLAILAGIGTAGVPGGSWPMIGAIMLKVGVPIEGVGLCMGVDRLLDMSRTVLNVSGDITIAACVSEIAGPTEQEMALAES